MVIILCVCVRVCIAYARTHAQLNLQTPSICAKYRYFSLPFTTISLSCDLLVFLVACVRVCVCFALLPSVAVTVAAIVAAKRLIFKFNSSAWKMESVSYFNRAFFHPCGTNYSPRLNDTHIRVLLFMCRQFKVLSTQHLKRNKIQQMHPTRTRTLLLSGDLKCSPFFSRNKKNRSIFC